jgi:hypothetical protein
LTEKCKRLQSLSMVYRLTRSKWKYRHEVRRSSIAILCLLVGATLVGVALAGRSLADTSERWWAPGADRVLPKSLSYANDTGVTTLLNLGGPTKTSGHPFFTPLGANGRACVTCHQPADGMSLSVATIQSRWQATAGKDPLFAAIDGSNCPSLPQGEQASHSLLVLHGLFRIARPWPPHGPDGKDLVPQFTIEVVRDPSGCNLDKVYGLRSPRPMVSVFRRPRPAVNLKYVTAVGYDFEPKNGLPLPIDPKTGRRMSGNILADSRAGTLEEQALDAIRSHLEAHGKPNQSQIDAILAFETQLFAAQSADFVGGMLNEGGALGGPATLADSKAGVLKNAQHPQWEEFTAWEKPSDATPETQREFRESVARGAALFRDRTFLVSDNAGINSMNFGNPTRDNCNFCHNMTRTGMDVAPGQVDLGTTNEPHADPQPDLPLFKLTCDPKYAPHPFLGAVVYTHDPGFALTTGKCVDIGKITIQSMRGLAARPPYFSNGSAPNLRAVVEYYNRRYQIGLTEQEMQDLTNLMSVL